MVGEKNMDFETLKNYSTDKQVATIVKEYKGYIMKVIASHLQFYKGLPETMDDFFWEFMFEVPRIILEYNMEMDFKKYLGNKCKFFTLGKCKKLTNKNHRVMNEMVSLDETIQMIVPDFEEQFLHTASDSEKEAEVDMSILNTTEMRIYNYHYIHDMNYQKIADKMSVSRYKIEKQVKNIRKKLTSKTLSNKK